MDDAAKWAKAAIDLNPDYSGHMLLAQIYWEQGHEDQWVATLEEFLNQPDYGLEHGWVCMQIARYYMARKNWDKATPYAEGAADTYSAWGLDVLASCYEGTQQWKEAEKLRKSRGRTVSRPDQPAALVLLLPQDGPRRPGRRQDGLPEGI